MAPEHSTCQMCVVCSGLKSGYKLYSRVLQSCGPELQHPASAEDTDSLTLPNFALWSSQVEFTASKPCAKYCTRTKKMGKKNHNNQFWSDTHHIKQNANISFSMKWMILQVQCRGLNGFQQCRLQPNEQPYPGGCYTCGRPPGVRVHFGPAPPVFPIFSWSHNSAILNLKKIQLGPTQW